MALTKHKKCGRGWQAASGTEQCPWCRAEAAEADRDFQVSQRWAEQAAREKAEATLARIVESCRGKCECCGNAQHHRTGICKPCKHFHGTDKTKTTDNWTPPAAWGMEGTK